MSTTKKTKTGSRANQVKKPPVGPPEPEPAGKSKNAQTAKSDGTSSENGTVDGNAVAVFPKKPSPEVKERVREKLQMHQLQTELTKKRIECDILREGGRQIREELNYQKEVLSQQTDENIRRLELENSELSAVLEEQRRREGEMQTRVEDLEKDLGDASEKLKEAQKKRKTLEEDKKRMEEEREELRKTNQRLVQETSAAKAEATETARRADDAEKKAAQELQKRQEVEAKNEEVVKEKDAAVFERDEAQASCKTLEEHIERMEREKRERPSEATQTDLRTCVSCVSKTEYKGDITVMESCSLLPYFIHGDRRNLIVPLRRKESKVIDLNDVQSSARRPTPPHKPKRTTSNQSTKLPSLLKTKKEIGGREIQMPDPFLTGKFNVAINSESSSQALLQLGQILVVDPQGDGYYYLLDENGEQLDLENGD